VKYVYTFPLYRAVT